MAAPISQARRAACLNNAQKSTGPRTPRGRARSARNATKHGLAGQGVSLLPEDQALLEHRATCWSKELGAVGDLEHEYVAIAASASVRRRRAEITEADNATERLAKAHARAIGRARSHRFHVSLRRRRAPGSTSPARCNARYTPDSLGTGTIPARPSSYTIRRAPHPGCCRRASSTATSTAADI